MVTFHMTKLINQHAGTQVQHRRAAPHHLFHHLRGTNTWAPIVAPWGSACSSVPLCQGWWHQNFPSALPQDAKKKGGKKKHCIKSAIPAGPGIGCVSDVKARDSHISAWCWTDKTKETQKKNTYTFLASAVLFLGSDNSKQFKFGSYASKMFAFHMLKDPCIIYPNIWVLRNMIWALLGQ